MFWQQLDNFRNQRDIHATIRNVHFGEDTQTLPPSLLRQHVSLSLRIRLIRPKSLIPSCKLGHLRYISPRQQKSQSLYEYRALGHHTSFTRRLTVEATENRWTRFHCSSAPRSSTMFRGCFFFENLIREYFPSPAIIFTFNNNWIN